MEIKNDKKIDIFETKIDSFLEEDCRYNNINVPNKGISKIRNAKYINL
tara:strand:+ start:2005 stop:2148 length:144 start_codon:yes stop_codon:yes gene_type:complete